jgi:hypothetical protein
MAKNMTAEQRARKNAYQREYDKKNYLKKKALRERYRDRHKENQLKAKYGITLDEYNQMLEKQNGVCALCHQPERTKISRGNGIRSLAVDHCHNTGIVRGLLCNTCNSFVGKYEKYKSIFSKIENYLTATGG